MEKSFVYTHHNAFIQSPAAEYPGWLYNLTIVSRAAMSIAVQVSLSS